MEEKLDVKEEQLKARLNSLHRMEQEILEREKLLKDKEKSKKQILLRLSPSLWNELASWAEEDFRSINSQIEYLLTECISKRKRTNKDNTEK